MTAYSQTHDESIVRIKAWSETKSSPDNDDADMERFIFLSVFSLR